MTTQPDSSARVTDWSGEGPLADDHWQPLTFIYTNHRGETAERRVRPFGIRWGSTEWHPEPQWLMRAFDLDKQAEREFALRDMNGLCRTADVEDQAGPAITSKEVATGTVDLIPATCGFDALRLANIARHAEWWKGVPLSLSFRGNEMAGEVGEACNIVKKLDRERLGLVGSRASVGDLEAELADVIICVDLIAMDLNIDLRQAIVEKFNATSHARGLTTRMEVEDA